MSSQSDSVSPVESGLLGDQRIDWYDLLDLGLEGRAWDASQCEHPYDRLPARAMGVVTDAVWLRSLDAAGLRCRFETDASAIHIRWSLRGWADGPAHVPMPAQTGVDLYGLDDADQWRWAGGAFMRTTGAGELSGTLFGATQGRRQYQLYLPYRHSVGSVRLGVPAGASVSRAAPMSDKPICFYGTSIVHGASATRPGLTYPAIVCRRLNRPFFNLGFGGNGPMHLEMAELIAELDVAAFIVAGCENMSPDLVAERAQPFAQIVRRKHPTTPILFIGNLRYGQGWHDTGREQSWRQKNTNLAAAVEALRAAGDTNTHYLPGEDLLGEDGEDLVDGTHPNDLGFMRMADTVTPTIQQLL